jgi:hypothetical protein
VSFKAPRGGTVLDIKLVIVVILFARHASMPVVKVLGAKDTGEESPR